MSIRPPVRRRLIFNDEVQDIDQSVFPNIEMEVSSINSTPLVPHITDPNPMLAVLLPKALQLSPTAPIEPQYDHIGYEVSLFPQPHRLCTATLNGGEESVAKHRVYSSPHRNGSEKRNGESNEPMTPTSPFGDSVISTGRYAPNVHFPNPATGEGYPDVPDTESV